MILHIEVIGWGIGGVDARASLRVRHVVLPLVEKTPHIFLFFLDSLILKASMYIDAKQAVKIKK